MNRFSGTDKVFIKVESVFDRFRVSGKLEALKDKSKVRGDF